MLGAQTQALLLRRELEVGSTNLDTDIKPPAEYHGIFPATDAVVCVTQNGCSCSCVAAFSIDSGPRVKLVDPAYGFRGALAQAALRFEGIRVFVTHSRQRQDVPLWIERRTTTLAELLDAGRLEPNHILHVTT